MGDSWGSKIIDRERRKGVSLALCQTDRGIQLLKQAKLHLEAVNLETAIKNNQQLKHASLKPRNRKIFDGLKKEKNLIH